MTLLAHYPLQEDSGSTAYDHSGNGYDGTVNGATPGATGLLGTTAYSFNGSGDAITNSGALGDITSGGFTVQAFMKGGSSSRGQSITIWNGDFSTDTSFFSLQNDSNKNLSLSYRDNTSNSFQTRSLNVTPGTTSWYQFVGVIDVTNGAWYGYVDGVLEADNTDSNLTNGFDFSSDGSYLAIGGQDQSSEYYFSGDITSVRIYDHILTASEVQYLYDVTQQQSVLSSKKSLTSSGPTADYSQAQMLARVGHQTGTIESESAVSSSVAQNNDRRHD